MSKPPADQIKSMLCNVSSHQWGAWILDEKSCTTTRKCERCKAEETKEVEHVWGEWKFFLHKCVQVRVCVHCAQREIRDAEHNWDEWKNTKEYNCSNGKKVRECKHCHEIEKSPDELIHTWEEWQTEKEKCQKERVCQTCGKMEYAPDHVWGAWNLHSGKCDYFRECQTCGSSEHTFQHAWGPWKMKDPICVEIRECENCGVLDYSDKKNPSKEIRHEYEFVRTWADTSQIEQYRHDIGKRYQIDLWKCKRCGEVRKEERYDYIVTPQD